MRVSNVEREKQEGEGEVATDKAPTGKGERGNLRGANGKRERRRKGKGSWRRA